MQSGSNRQPVNQFRKPFCSTFTFNREHTDDSVSLRNFRSHRLISSFHISFTSSPVPGTLHCTKLWRLNLTRPLLKKSSRTACIMRLGSRRSCSRVRRRRHIITTHHSPTSHTSLITAQLITPPLPTPHLSYLYFSHHLSHLHFIILSQQNSSQLRGQQFAFRVVAARNAPAFRVAGAAHRASGRSCGARPPLGRGCFSRGRGSTQNFLEELQRRGRAARLPFALSHGRRSIQSLLEQLRRAWMLLGRGCLLCGRRSTQSFLDRWPWLPFLWQAQYTEPPGAIITIDGSDLACRRFSIDLVFLFSTIIWALAWE